MSLGTHLKTQASVQSSTAFSDSDTASIVPPKLIVSRVKTTNQSKFASTHGVNKMTTSIKPVLMNM